jgi:hypothetical protein
MTAEDFRRIALELDGVVERAHMGHPDFRANGKIFASLDAKEEIGTVKLTPDEQAEVMRGTKATIEPAAGAWGRQGWTRIRLAAADVATVRGALLLAWQSIVDSPRDRNERDRQRSRKRAPRRRA